MYPNELLLGDVAPDLKVRAFIKGEPIASFQRGRIYVVELWATWCGPCIEAMPHLTDLQAKYPDVSFVGVAVTAKDLDALEKFVKEQGDAIGYRVAADIPPGEGEKLGWMHRHWGEAAYQSGIPTSFIVDANGVVAWIGHPKNLEPALQSMVDGSYDVEEEARKYSTKLAKDRVRESKHLEKVIGERNASADKTGVLRAFDEAFEAFPDMEASIWGQRKFEFLIKTDRNAALTYAQYLFDTVASENGKMLADLGNVLVATVTTHELERDASLVGEFATLTVAILMRAETLLADRAHPYTMMRLYQSLAQILLEVDLPEEARQRVLKAREWGVLAGGDDAYLARFDELARRCEAALC